MREWITFAPMGEIKQISSLHNPLVKKISLLREKSRERKKSGLFIIEGQREVLLALKGKYEIETVVFSKNIISEPDVVQLFEGAKKVPGIISVSKPVYQKLAYRETTEGIIAIAKGKAHDLGSLSFKRVNPLILVAEAPEKPGNIGALLRTADAANLDAIIIADPKGDLYSPNIIRSSVGCVFTKNIGLGSSTEVIDFLKSRNIKIYCAALSASQNYIKTDFKEAVAIVVGTESVGLSDVWLKNATQNIIIPMQGEIDSMNVSVSASILIFEALRQRNFK